MKLKKIHRILKFKPSDWMKSYIDFNTQKRKESTNESDKNLFEINEQCCIRENYRKYEK